MCDKGFISPLQRKEFNQDRFGSSCQYQTSVFQDNRVSPDVIPDSFTHLNKCQDFTASINDSKQVNMKFEYDGSWVFFYGTCLCPLHLHITRKLYQIMSPRQEGEVYLSNGRVLPTPDGSDSSGFSEKAASSELSCSDYCSTGGE